MITARAAVDAFHAIASRPSNHARAAIDAFHAIASRTSHPARCALALMIFVAMSACGSDVPTAPRISMLRLNPEDGVRPGELLTVTVHLIDEDEDLAGGQAEIGLLREGDKEGEIFRVPLDASGSIKEATISLKIRLPTGAIPGHYDLSVVILDSATRRSNPLVTKFDVLN